MNEYDYLAKAKDKMADEKYIEVISLCKKALKLNENLPEAYDFLGNAKYEMGEYREAIESFSKGIEMEPDNAKHYYDRSWAFYKIYEVEDAIVDMNKALEINPKSSLYYYERGRFEQYIERYREAISDFTKGIELKPTENKYISRGNCYMEIEEYDLAYNDFTSAIEIESESHYAYYRRGLLKMRLEKYPEAIKDFEKSIEIYPDAAAAYIQIGYAKIYLGKKDAMKYFNKAVKICPFAEYYLEKVTARGKILFRENALKNLSANLDIEREFSGQRAYNEKQAQEDIKDLNKALEDEPNNKEALQYRADRYYYLEKYNKAIDDCTRLVELEPDNKDYYYIRAISLQSNREYQAAIDDCNKISELNGKEIDAKVLFLKSNAEYSLKRYQNVINNLNIALSVKETCGSYYYRGLAHYQLKHFRQAYSDIKNAIKLKFDVLEIYEDKLPKPLEFAINFSDKNKKAAETPVGLTNI
ncbi:tetratricopeptide repeat protein [bacterium]|nr:tetratricopeptide repeat protein [bacterium]